MRKVLPLLALLALSAPTWADDNEASKLQAADPSEVVELGEIFEVPKAIVSGIADRINRVEVYYLNTQKNRQALHDIGIRVTGEIFDNCDADQIRNTGAGCPNIANELGDLEYMRWGAIDVAGIINVSGREKPAAISHATITVLEAATDKGFFWHVGRIGYVQHNQEKFLDFRLPVSLVGGAKNYDIKITKSGVVKIFVSAEINLLAGYAQHQNMAYSNPAAIKDEYLNSLKGLGFVGAEGKGQLGLKLFDRFLVGGFAKSEISTTFGGTKDSGGNFGRNANEFGGQVGIKIYKGLSIMGNGSYGQVNYFGNDNFRAADGGSLSESYWQAGAGLRVDF